MALLVFSAFVLFLLWLSWYLGRASSSSASFFVAGGQIHWFVNGVALTGGYLSAASFLGICGMIAFKGFDGYLYSIGFLSGWVVALFVVAEPLRRLGKYTFADALGARFNSRAIHLAASISTLVICLCYLVPQMVGAGVLIEPLLGLAHHWGVIIVGVVVIVVVASAGMSSTTYVQFIKASLLIAFSAVLVIAICVRGLQTVPRAHNGAGELVERYVFATLAVPAEEDLGRFLGRMGLILRDQVDLPEVQGQQAQTWVLADRVLPLTPAADGDGWEGVYRGQRLHVAADVAGVFASAGGGEQEVVIDGLRCAMVQGGGQVRLASWWLLETDPEGSRRLREAQDVTVDSSGARWLNGRPAGTGNEILPMGRISRFGPTSGHDDSDGWVGPLKLLSVFASPDTEVELPRSSRLTYGDSSVSLYYHATVPGNILMRPGGNFDLTGGNFWSRLDFISLMLALFFGTAALPHVLIRYYTVRDSRAARNSTIVAISAIGLFYVLTLYLGLGAIATGSLNPLTENMSAPLLARSFGELLFAIITALAFATVLGTVSGLIVAASGAVANDLMDKYMGLNLTDRGKVIAAKVTAVSVGVVAVVFGILFRGINVGFLVGWAFAVAASANFPAIFMVLFWKRTSAAGVVASILVGIAASLGVILVGPDMFELYGVGRVAAWVPLSQPAIVAMPLSLLTLVAVSLLGPRQAAA